MHLCYSRHSDLTNALANRIPRDASKALKFTYFQLAFLLTGMPDATDEWYPRWVLPQSYLMHSSLHTRLHYESTHHHHDKLLVIRHISTRFQRSPICPRDTLLRIASFIRPTGTCFHWLAMDKRNDQGMMNPFILKKNHVASAAFCFSASFTAISWFRFSRRFEIMIPTY